jgi:NAD(P)-dependent dehydrogenase (short-subunit alcohol dehydrogenase family)
MRELNQRVAVITGAASGIGLAMAERFARQGMSIVMADIEASALESASARVRDLGVDVLPAIVDVSDAAAVEDLAVQTYERFGATHVLCNNAGVGGGGAQATLTVAEWNWVLGVNLHGVVHGIASFLPRMVASGEDGHIVNTASMAGHLAFGGMGPYNASKYAVVGISESLFHELAGTSIGVSVLCPGWVNTRIGESSRNRPSDVPERMARPEDAARAAFITQVLADGLAPSAIADLVHDAIVEDKFWIFSHPEMMPGIRQRADEILAGRNPGTGSGEISTLG